MPASIVLTDEEDRTLSELKPLCRNATGGSMLKDGPYLSLLKSLSVTSTRCGQPWTMARGWGIMGGSDGVQNKMARG